ncbi:hypothetical protein V8E36_002016 [Tilletia maclaganii]
MTMTPADWTEVYEAILQATRPHRSNPVMLARSILNCIGHTEQPVRDEGQGSATVEGVNIECVELSAHVGSEDVKSDFAVRMSGTEKALLRDDARFVATWMLPIALGCTTRILYAEGSPNRLQLTVDTGNKQKRSRRPTTVGISSHTKGPHFPTNLRLLLHASSRLAITTPSNAFVPVCAGEALRREQEPGRHALGRGKIALLQDTSTYGQLFLLKDKLEDLPALLSAYSVVTASLYSMKVLKRSFWLCPSMCQSPKT